MTNTSLLNATYDLTHIISKDAIEDPVSWLGYYSGEMNSIVVISLLSVFGIIIFAYTRTLSDVSDSEAAMYAGLITSIVGLLIFLAEVSITGTHKIIQWGHLFIFLQITSEAIFINKASTRW